jgi:hypothetical protein
MDRHATRSVEIPKWSALLVEAVNQPGMIMEAYRAFHAYSIGNQLLALAQCQMRGLQPSPINTFPKWKELGRTVKRGERALILCMPITRKRRDQETEDDARSNANDDPNQTNGEHLFTSFVHQARWFVITQTVGAEFTAPPVPLWDAERALAALDLEQIPFTDTDGNCQGYATRKRQIAINPVAQLPTKTLFHEAAHVILGHVAEADLTAMERTPKNLREVEAEAVALLCGEALNLEGADFCRGYIQQWVRQGKGYNAEAIPEKSAQKIFRAADQILRAGRLSPERDDEPGQ